jgi:hypothetical protein
VIVPTVLEKVFVVEPIAVHAAYKEEVYANLGLKVPAPIAIVSPEIEITPFVGSALVSNQLA